MFGGVEIDLNPRLWGQIEPCSPFPSSPKHRLQPGTAWPAGQDTLQTCSGLLWLCSLAVLQMPGDGVAHQWTETTPNPQTLSFNLYIKGEHGLVLLPGELTTQLSLEEKRVAILNWPDKPSVSQAGSLGSG